MHVAEPRHRNYTHICSSRSMNAVVVIEPVLCFLNFFQIFLWSGMSPRQLTLPVSFDTKKHSNLSEFCVSVCRLAEYAVD